ncbi:MAG: glycoside hydrolase family 3 C-terminal domain-containing protein [Duncaniella sp.]|nr:glycoside hydrolase family 3 C-terminal domain-containing protein [Duncaniella sp.]
MKKLSLMLLGALLGLGAAAQGADASREKAQALIDRMTLDEKISLMMDASPAIERLGVPQFNWWSEALHGVARAGTATVLPQAIGMAATFDDDAVGEAFEMVSDEARAKFNGFRKRGGIRRYEGLAFWTPNINIFRDPRWGRGQETYGEDPYLTQRMGVAVVEGLQGPKDAPYMKTLAGAKHFAVHSGPEWNRHTFDAKNIDPRDLWETYLPSFKVLVDSGVAQVMCAYNRYEGEPCCSNKKLLTQILRDEWGYDRVIVTDCWAMRDFVVDWGHHTHASEPEAGADAVMSGTDLECGPLFKTLRKAYDQGLIDEKYIDQALLRVLTERFRLGEIDSAATPWDNLTPETTVDTPEHRRIALDMARKSMTLLKNDGILPLDKNKRLKVLVMGPNAADSAMQWGNYNGFPSFTTTILDGIREYAPDARYIRGCDHVVSSDKVSVFNLFDGGMKATYWNGEAGASAPAAEAAYTLPLSFDTGGATVFAPGVALEDFSARYTGRFVPSEDGDYIIDLKGAKGREVVTVDGREVIRREPGGRNAHTGSYMFRGKKGVPVEIALDFRHYEGEATLKFDVLAPSREVIDFADADVVIFAGGISPKLEGEEMKVSVPGFRGGDRETIELPSVQRQMVRKAVDAGKKVVFVNCSGSAVALAPEDSICSAILQAWYPGQAGGQAVAEVLFGDYNPAGRLPVTFYASDAQLPDFEDYSMDGRTYRFFKGEPLYPFGHGLSYTTFSYGKPSVAREGQNVRVSIPVSNTGAMDGDEVVQLYVSSDADPTGPVKNLRGFRRVSIPKGETRTVEFTLTPVDFATFDHKTQRLSTRPGTYGLTLAPSSKGGVKTSVTL